MAEPFTIYKLTILNMLSKVDFPLSNTQISNFFLEHDYTDYFRIQQVINDLVDAELILAENTHATTQYRITAAGRETLGFFRDKISDAIETDMLRYLDKNQLKLKQENSVLADYYRAPGGYAVRCQVRSDSRTMLDLTISVKTRTEAEAICNNWKQANEDVYAFLIDTLIK